MRDETAANKNKSRAVGGAVSAARCPAIHEICAFTVREFCCSHRISIGFFYLMRAEGWGPREMRAGTRVLISKEAASDWRRSREAAASAGASRKVESAS